MSASAVQPYGSWDEGLGALCDALENSERTAIVAARLASTADRTGISAADICALALIAPSGACFAQESSNDADLVTAGKQQLDPAISETISEIARGMREALSSIEKIKDDRQKFVLSIFPERDARRILVDSTFGISAAALADVSHELGEADPFSRLAQRLTLWFKPSTELTRYGLPWPEDSSSISSLVNNLLDKDCGSNAEPARHLLQVWAGKEEVQRSPKGLSAIVSLAYKLKNEDQGGWCVLAFEIFASLLLDCDEVDEVAEFDRTVGGLVLRDGYDPNRRATADLREWLKNNRKLDLTCDPSGILQHLVFLARDWPEKPMTIAEYAAQELTCYGHAVCPTGPFPLAYANGRDGGLRTLVADAIPECADLMRLLDIEGEECEDIRHDASYWATLNPNEDDVSVRWAIYRAHEREDFSLCDILIGVWLLHCTLFLPLPLPYVSDLARSIRKVPPEDRHSIKSVLSWLRRATMNDPPLQRSVDALLSYLPPVPIAPERNLRTEMREEWFTPKLWDKLAPKEQERLLRAEERFRELRVRGLDRVDAVEFGELFPHWSSVVENLLFRAICRIDAHYHDRANSDKSLGRLIDLIEKAKRQPDPDGLPYKGLLPFHARKILEKLNHSNIRVGKHSGEGPKPGWQIPVELRSGLYFGGCSNCLWRTLVASHARSLETSDDHT